MNLFIKYTQLKESANTSTLDVGNGYTAKINQKNGSHFVKIFKHGVYLQGADYENKNLDKAHEYAYSQAEYHKTDDDAMDINGTISTDKSKLDLSERINMPQGHLESADRISDDSKKNGVAPKKQMGNRTPLEIIAKILAGR